MKYEGIETPQIKQAISNYVNLVGTQLPLLSPISPNDACIIDTMYLIVKSHYPNFDLEGYKVYPDKEVLASLQNFAGQVLKQKKNEIKGKVLVVTPPQEEAKEPLIVFEDVNETALLVNIIFAFEKKDSNKLVINRTPEKTKGLPLFANTELTFTSKAKRDKAYNTLIETI